MRSHTFVLGTLPILLGTAVTRAIPSSKGLLIVLNKSDHEAALVDAETY